MSTWGWGGVQCSVKIRQRQIRKFKFKQGEFQGLPLRMLCLYYKNEESGFWWTDAAIHPTSPPCPIIQHLKTQFGPKKSPTLILSLSHTVSMQAHNKILRSVRRDQGDKEEPVTALGPGTKARIPEAIHPYSFWHWSEVSQESVSQESVLCVDSCTGSHICLLALVTTMDT